MAFYSPKKKKEYYKAQIESGVKNDGIPLSESDIAYRKGYINSVNESSRLYAYKNATEAERTQYREKKRAERKAQKAEFQKYLKEKNKKK